LHRLVFFYGGYQLFSNHEAPLVTFESETLPFMTMTFIIINCMLLSCCTYGQTPPGRLATSKEQELMEKSCDCAKVKSIPFVKRLKHYPFSEAKEIQLVSFKKQLSHSNWRILQG